NGTKVDPTGDTAREVIPSSLRWSPDGETLAYLGYANYSQATPSLYLMSVGGHGHEEVIRLSGLNASPWGGHHPNPVGGYEPPGLDWTATGAILLRAARTGETAGRDGRGKSRLDWWLLSPK